ncbi:MAG: hypothetical protein M1829_005180 [Trizodia sp. TS-e1964]|nr:MAG: hypothetical protein M1829_005180 [Trizodia sp. TS-e1964]
MRYTPLLAAGTSFTLLAAAAPFNEPALPGNGGEVCHGYLEILLAPQNAVHGCISWDATLVTKLDNPRYLRKCGVYSIFKNGLEVTVYLLPVEPGKPARKCAMILEKHPSGEGDAPFFRCPETPPEASKILWVPREYSPPVQGSSGRPVGYISYSRDPAFAPLQEPVLSSDRTIDETEVRTYSTASIICSQIPRESPPQ